MSTSPPPPPPPPRKFPPPCWTPHETLALLHAFRDRWFSLRRRNLRSPDWDAVASDLALRCPSPSLPKSSLQCRHKIEKLRQRYRTEKNRSLASSWDLFPFLDSMQIGAVGSRLNPHRSNLDDEAELGGRFGGVQAVQVIGTQISLPVRNQSKVNGNYGSNLSFETSCGFHVKSLPPGFRSSNHDQADWSFDANDKDGGFYYRLEPSGFKSVNCNKFDWSSTSNIDSGIRIGSPSCSRLGSGKNGTAGVKRKADQVAEMVSSIKMLGEGFASVEKMKMEMVREIAKMRMEAEMKRTEMILKSQERIVDVFVNALLGNKKKVKMEEQPDCLMK